MSAQQGVAELRYGAIRRNWGSSRMLRLDARIAEAETVHSGPELIQVYAQLGQHHAANLRSVADIQPPGRDHGIELDFGP